MPILRHDVYLNHKHNQSSPQFTIYKKSIIRFFFSG